MGRMGILGRMGSVGRREHLKMQSFIYPPITTIISTTTLISCQKGLDVLATRRLKKRSLLKVNEHFLDKVDDTDDPLSQEITCTKRHKYSNLAQYA